MPTENITFEVNMVIYSEKKGWVEMAMTETFMQIPSFHLPLNVLSE